MATRSVVFDDGGDITALVHDLRRTASESMPMAANIASHHAGEVVDRWRASVPRDTGKLHDSIQHDFEFDGRDPVGIAYSDWFVSRFREYGTATQPPHGEANAAAEAQMDAFARDIASLARL